MSFGSRFRDKRSFMRGDSPWCAESKRFFRVENHGEWEVGWKRHGADRKLLRGKCEAKKAEGLGKVSGKKRNVVKKTKGAERTKAGITLAGKNSGSPRSCFLAARNVARLLPWKRYR
jgi:hypothetical protein